MEPKKLGPGLYVQLPPDIQKRIFEDHKRRMNMPIEERIQEIAETLRRGVKLIDEAFTTMQQDANIDHITGKSE